MKQVFIIVDCSGSIVADDVASVGKINELIRDLTGDLSSAGVSDVKVITYSDKAEIHWQSGKGAFLDILQSKFGGRSNLGAAYALILDGYSKAVLADEAVLALISDGEATDNYKKYLNRLEQAGVKSRIALSTGNSTLTTDNHAAAYDLSYKFSDNRDDFIERTVELAE